MNIEKFSIPLKIFFAESPTFFCKHKYHKCKLFHGLLPWYGDCCVQALPLVGTLWGILLFGEYHKSSRRTYMLLSAMLIMFAVAVTLLIASSSQRGWCFPSAPVQLQPVCQPLPPVTLLSFVDQEFQFSTFLCVLASMRIAQAGTESRSKEIRNSEVKLASQQGALCFSRT